MYLDRMTLPKPEPKGKKVAVIGAGPAGIAAAITLAAQGYGVTFEVGVGVYGSHMQSGAFIVLESPLLGVAAVVVENFHPFTVVGGGFGHFDRLTGVAVDDLKPSVAFVIQDELLVCAAYIVIDFQFCAVVFAYIVYVEAAVLVLVSGDFIDAVV